MSKPRLKPQGRRTVSAAILFACVVGLSACGSGGDKATESAASGYTLPDTGISSDVSVADDAGIFVPGMESPVAVTSAPRADVDPTSLTLDNLGDNIPTFAQYRDRWAVDLLDFTCGGLRIAKANGEDGPAAVQRIADEMTTGRFFQGQTLANKGEALMTQLYSVTLQCPDLSDYVGTAVYPGA